MGAAASADGEVESLSRITMLKVLIVVLVISCPILLIEGSNLAQYQTTGDEPLSYLPMSALPLPDIALYFNISLAPGTTTDGSVVISYNTTYDHLTFGAAKNELLIWTPAPENDPSHGQKQFVFFGFIFLQSAGTMNETVYGSKGDLIDSQVFGIDNSTLPKSAFYLLEANGNGTYYLKINNTGQSEFLLTISIGYSATYWSKPYFYVGVIAVILGIIGIVSLPIISTQYGRKAKLREAPQENLPR